MALQHALTVTLLAPGAAGPRWDPDPIPAWKKWGDWLDVMGFTKFTRMPLTTWSRSMPGARCGCHG